MSPTIIFQDDDLFAINKPSGWITNEADTTSSQPVIQTWVRNNFDYPLKGNKEYRDGVVHRLDKETSGVLLIAKTVESFNRLQTEFKERRVEKKYIALLHGHVGQETGTITGDLGRLPWRRDRFGILPGGRGAATDYKVLKYYDGYSLVEFSPKTGRTHQIRIHAKSIGHPVVSDTFYAGRKTARKDRLWCPRLFLHAGKIKILKYDFSCPLPPDLEKALSVIH